MNSSQVIEIISKELQGDWYSPIVVDKVYSCCTKRWILEDLCSSLRSNIVRNDLHYEVEQNDCDDFSFFAYWCCLTAVMLAKQKHRARKSMSGITVGVLAYHKDNGVNHAICFAIVENEEIIYFEPQNSREVKLTPNEKNNCLFSIM